MNTTNTTAQRDALKKQIEEAAKNSPDMNVPDNSQPVDDDVDDADGSEG
ncbi:hypothetical protein PO883_34085 [Massilia sp. DJPM01]|nr:hypothetical protein [Massilia sp. DJPM01]MDM5182200.1 hypothetical protein [Massilia sp. DJPM01]